MSQWPLPKAQVLATFPLFLWLSCEEEFGRVNSGLSCLQTWQTVADLNCCVFGTSQFQAIVYAVGLFTKVAGGCGGADFGFPALFYCVPNLERNIFAGLLCQWAHSSWSTKTFLFLVLKDFTHSTWHLARRLGVILEDPVWCLVCVPFSQVFTAAFLAASPSVSFLKPICVGAISVSRSEGGVFHSS